MHIFLIRHGQSEANAREEVQGYEPPLTDRGRAQARFVAERFSHMPVDVILASPMPRATETAQIIGEAIGKPVAYSDLLVENRQPSALVGRSDHDPEVVTARRIMREHFADPDYRHSDEETFADLKARGKEALVHVGSHDAQHVLVVSHGAFIRVLVALMLFGDALTARELGSMRRFFYTTNTGITWCERGFYKDVPEQWVLRTWMDHAHLGEA